MIIACRYSVSFLKTSMNSTMPRLPTLKAPLSSSTRGSPSEYISSFEMSSLPISTDVSWLFGSTGGTTPMPLRLRFENERVDDRKFFVACAKLFLQAETTDRAQIAFDMNAQHFLEFLAQMARNEMQRLLEHWTAFDGINRIDELSRPRCSLSTSELLPEPPGPIR